MKYYPGQAEEDHASSTSRYVSPGGRHVVKIEWTGQEVQMGVPYFYAKVDDQYLGDRAFGDVCVWSGDSKRLALQHWVTTDKALGPETQLLIVDPEARIECALSRTKGFIEPLELDGGSVTYRIDTHYGQGEPLHRELPGPAEWCPLQTKLPYEHWSREHPVAAVLLALLWALLWVLPWFLALLAGGIVALWLRR